MNISKKIYSRLRSFILFHCVLFINYILLICYLEYSNIDLEVLFSLISSYLLTGIAAFLLNDFYDQEIDLKAGKSNLTATINPYLIGFLICIGFAISFLLIQRISTNASYLLIAQSLALLAYSHPFLRLKTKPIFGIVLDSIYAYLIPILLLFVVYEVDLFQTKYIAFLLFNFSIGLRDIILHQKADKENDLKSGINSFAIHFKFKINKVINGAEIVASLSLCIFLINSFWKAETNLYNLVLLLAYIVVLVLQIVKIKKAVDNNYLMQFYVVISSLIIGYWLFEQNKFVFSILLIHPYVVQFIIQLFQILNQIKIGLSIIVNNLLYYGFKLLGRDLKEKPLYKKKTKHN